MQKLYYFDSNATTQVAPEVLQAMLPFFTDLWGNPSSSYRFGHEVTMHLDRARASVAALIEAEPSEIVFTSCGSESNNTAINSALTVQPQKRHLITSAVEHSANLRYCEHLETQGYEVTYLPVNPDGLLTVSDLEKSVRPDTAIVSLMWANNETGILFPIQEIAEFCRNKQIPFHTDAVQAVGKVPISVKKTGVDFLSMSAHKLHAPKGIGALYVRKKSRFVPYIFGGHQEDGRRAGTENVAQIVGFGRAAELAMTGSEETAGRVSYLRDRLEREVLKNVAGSQRNGAVTPRLCNTTNLALDGLETEALLIRLDQLGICASSGSACRSGSMEPSHVLMAMGFPISRSRGSVRFSLSRYTTEEEIEYLLKHLPSVVRGLRRLSSG